MPIVWDIFWVLLGLLGSTFFAGMETGLVSLNRVRLRHLVERGNRRARILNGFVENSERLLGTTLVGNNLANVLVAVGAVALAVRFFGASYAVELAATVAVAAVVLILGEITPKTLSRRYPHRLCMTFADLLNAAAWLFAPLVVLVGVLMRWIARLGGGGVPPEKLFISRKELKLLAREGEDGGALTPEERQMIHDVFDFSFKSVGDVMIPLSRTVTVPRETSVEQLLALSERTGLARIPVRDGDHVSGVVNTYEILFEEAVCTGAPVTPFIRKPLEVLSTERIDRVLARLQAGRCPLSVVIDPDGRPVGLITIEDIVEEIIGDVAG